MVKEAKKALTVGLAGLFFLIAMTHLTFHVLVFGASVPGISGNAIGNIDSLEEVATKYTGLSAISLIIIIGEWFVVLLILLFILIKGEVSLSKDLKEGPRKIKISTSNEQTDLDTLYEIIMERKSLRLRTISKLFGISKQTALDWCRILEEGNLIIIRYPTIGDAKIILNEEKDDKKEE